MTPHSDPILRGLIEAQRAIPAIKHIRDTYGLDLTASRALYEELKQERFPRPVRVPRTTPLWLRGLMLGVAIAIIYLIWLLA